MGVLLNMKQLKTYAEQVKKKTQEIVVQQVVKSCKTCNKR